MHEIDIAVVWSEADELLLSTLFKFLLQPPRYHAEYRTEVNAAYERCVGQIPTIIIIKRTIQDKDDGLMLCQRLRNTASLRSVPIILGWIDIPSDPYPSRAILAQEYGANGCFGRVCNIEGLQHMILHLIDNPMTRGLLDQ
jgi:hypothetical protein